MSFGTEHRCYDLPDLVYLYFVKGEVDSSPFWCLDLGGEYHEDYSIEYCPWCGNKLLIGTQDLVPHLKEILCG